MSIAQTATSPLPKPYVPPRSRADSEFLAPALELLETPASPVRLGFLWTICLFATTAIVWSYLGHVDILATAQGKVQPTGRMRVVEPLVTGRVLHMPFGNGSAVAAGDVLVAFDPAEVDAEREMARLSLQSAKAEVTRRRFAAAVAQDGRPVGSADIPWDNETADVLRQREARVFAADLGQLHGALASLEAQHRQKESERDQLDRTMAAERRLIDTLQERVDMRSTLAQTHSGTRAAVIDALETLQYQQTQLAVQEGQRAAAIAAMELVTRDMAKSRDTFIAENAQKLAGAERQIEEETQKLAKADAQATNLTLRAPIAGRVEASVVTNVGQVLTAGQEAMRIVPAGSSLELEAYLPNRDIGFVKVGQEASVKFDAFPFTRYGAVPAHVVRVAADAIPQPDANQTEADPTRPNPNSFLGGAQRVQNLVFPITLALDRDFIDVDGTEVKVTSGMAASADLKTGTRRLIDYLLSPLATTIRQALHDR